MTTKPITKEDILDRVVVDERGCWIWQGRLREGYGVLRGRQVTHIVYELWIGPVPKGTQVHHRCETPGDRAYRACCNPSDLLAVTKDMNQMLRWRKLFGQMPRRDLRVARFVHKEIGERLKRRYADV